MVKDQNVSISIIIPTFNAEKTLKNCLDSIVKQEVNDIEAWIIDGNSTDETLKIVQDYSALYPFIKFISEQDKGIYDAMNKGIKLCTGDWIYFIGSDDTLYEKDVLAKIKIHASESKNLIVYGNVIFRGENKWNLDNVVFNGEYTLEKMLVTNICHQSIFYHKTIFEKYGNYDLKYISSADQDFNLKCYANTNFDYIDIIIANFFVGGFSTVVEDVIFNQHRGALFLKYFGKRIFNKSFSSVRLYLKRAAFSNASQLSIIKRIYCLIAYIKLKTMAVITNIIRTL